MYVSFIQQYAISIYTFTLAEVHNELANRSGQCVCARRIFCCSAVSSSHTFSLCVCVKVFFSSHQFPLNFLSFMTQILRLQSPIWHLRPSFCNMLTLSMTVRWHLNHCWAHSQLGKCNCIYLWQNVTKLSLKSYQCWWMNQQPMIYRHG